MTSETEKCSIAHNEGKVTCAVHNVELEEVGAKEVMSPGLSPYPFEATAWRCRISNQVILDIQTG
jgi:hypothetical protein